MPPVSTATAVLGSQACPQHLCITDHPSRPCLAWCETLHAAVMPPTHSRLIAYSREGLSHGGHEAGRQEFLLYSCLHTQLATLPGAHRSSFPPLKWGHSHLSPEISQPQKIQMRTRYHSSFSCWSKCPVLWDRVGKILDRPKNLHHSKHSVPIAGISQPPGIAFPVPTHTISHLCLEIH